MGEPGERSFRTAHPKFTFPRDFPGGPVVKTLPSNAGDTGLIPGEELMPRRNRPQESTCHK